MNTKEYLKKFGIPTLDTTNERFNELKEQFCEMGQLKSNFDIEKFTVKREGHFIAHQFHMLMRQYSLATGELRRMLIQKEQLVRTLDRLEKRFNDGEETFKTVIDSTELEVDTDLEMESKKNEIDLLDVNIVNKACMCSYFEKARKKIIENNEGNVPTNEQYQKEEPEYWKWFLGRKAIWQAKMRATGISEGVLENINYLEEPALIDSDFQCDILSDNGFPDMAQIADGINKDMKRPDRQEFRQIDR